MGRMTTIREALAMALDYQHEGKLADAAGVYRLILTVQPYNPIALTNLRLIDPQGEAPRHAAPSHCGFAAAADRAGCSCT